MTAPASRRIDRYRSFIDDWDAFVAACARPLPVDARVNTLRTSPAALGERLARLGVDGRAGVVGSVSRASLSPSRSHLRTLARPVLPSGARPVGSRPRARPTARRARARPLRCSRREDGRHRPANARTPAASSPTSRAVAGSRRCSRTSTASGSGTLSSPNTAARISRRSRRSIAPSSTRPAPQKERYAKRRRSAAGRRTRPCAGWPACRSC